MQPAIFAAGCFWGVQYYFDQIPGVIASDVGYTGGTVANPTYKQVCTHTTGHAEAVRLAFDPHMVTYATLVRHFFRMHDPTQLNRQGPNEGDDYRSVIFYFDDSQKATAERVMAEIQENEEKPIVTQIVPVSQFYVAEREHQKYTKRTGNGMCHIPYKPL